MDSGSFENSTDKKSGEKNDLDDGLKKEQKSDVLSELHENLEVISLVSTLLEEVTEKNETDDKVEDDKAEVNEQELDVPAEQHESLEEVNRSVSSLIEVIEKNEADNKIEEAKAEENEQKTDVSSELYENLEVISLVSTLLEEVTEENETDDKVEDDKAEVNEQESDVSLQLYENLEVISLFSSFLEEVAEMNETDDKVEDELTTKPLSTRLEYLSRPTKDILDKFIDFRLDGALPENAYPSWNLMPLPTKLPFDNCPIPITKRNLGTNLFLPPPANDFDLADENNLRLPSASYENLHDSYVKKYFQNESVSEHLRKEGFISESGKTKCTLSNINKYRVYQRRILAAEVQKTLRDQDEEFKKERAKGMEEQIKEDMQRYHEMRTQGRMRRRIKDTITSIKDSSMENQMKRDKQVLNSLIQRRMAQKKRVESVNERHQEIFDEHMRNKYSDDDKRKKKIHLAYAKKDLERLEHLCTVQERAKLKRREKLDEFWKRKSDWQKEWIEKGEELERRMQEEKKRNIEILERTGKLPLIFFEGQEKDSKTRSKEREKSKISLESEAETLSETRKSENKEESIQLDVKEIDTEPSQEKEIRSNVENLEVKHEEKISKSEKDIDEGVTESVEAEVKDTLSDSSLMYSERDESDKFGATGSVEKEKIIQPETSKEIDTSLPEEKDVEDIVANLVEKSEEKVMKLESDIDEGAKTPDITEIEDNLSGSSVVSFKQDGDGENEATDSVEKEKIMQTETSKEIGTSLPEEKGVEDIVANLVEKSEEKVMKLESDIDEGAKTPDTTEIEDNLSGSSVVSFKQDRDGENEATDSVVKEKIMQTETSKEIDTSLPEEKESEDKVENLDKKSEEKEIKPESEIDKSAVTQDTTVIEDNLTDSSLMAFKQDDDGEAKTAESTEEGKITDPETNKEIDINRFQEQESKYNVKNLEEESEEKVMKLKSDIDESITTPHAAEIEDNLSDSSLITFKQDEDGEVEAAESAEKGRITDHETNKGIDTNLFQEQDSKRNATNVDVISDENVIKPELDIVESPEKLNETEKKDDLSDPSLSEDENDKSEATKSVKENEDTQSESDTKEN